MSTLCLAVVAAGAGAAPAPATGSGTPAPHAWATKLTNVAAAANGGRIVGVSSTLDHNDPKFAASNLIDGKVYNPQTQTGSLGWVSDKYDPINMEYVIIGFHNNEQKTIGKIVIDPAAGVTPERWAKDISVEVSTETAEGPYQPVAELTLANKPQKQEFTILPAPARFVRLEIRTNYGSDRAVALGEVEMYEAVNTNDPMGDLISRMEGAVHELRQYRQNLVDMGSNATSLSEVTGAPTHDAALADPAGHTPLSPATLQLIDGQTDAAAVQDTATAPAGAARAATGIQPATNIAAAKNGGKIVDYSSIYMSTPGTPDLKYKPENLIDGQVYTVDKDGKGTGTFGWASEGFAPGREYVTIGFRNDRTHVINKLTLNPASEQSPGRWARRIDVQVTTGDAKKGPWHTVTTVTLQIQPVPQDFTFASVEAKYVRLVFMANGPALPGNTVLNINPDMTSDRAVALGEVEIYEPIVPAAALDSLIGHFEQILIDLKRLDDQKDKQPVALDTAPGAAGPQVANGDTAPAAKDGDTPAL